MRLSLFNRRRFFYIISYPRSGNTWVVNSLKDYLGAQRAEVEPSVYNGDVIHVGRKVRIPIRIAGKYDSRLPLGVKTHMTRSQFIKTRLPKEKTIYLVRDGRDVMISYYFYTYGFLGKDISKVTGFSNEDFCSFLKRRLPEYIDHVKGWMDADNKELFLRYEDFHRDYLGQLKRIKDFLKFKTVMAKHEVKNRNVDNFRKIDQFDNVLQGKNTDFYRKGIVGDWRNFYDNKSLKLYVSISGSFHRELGYNFD